MEEGRGGTRRERTGSGARGDRERRSAELVRKGVVQPVNTTGNVKLPQHAGMLNAKHHMCSLSIMPRQLAWLRDEMSLSSDGFSSSQRRILFFSSSLMSEKSSPHVFAYPAHDLLKAFSAG